MFSFRSYTFLSGADVIGLNCCFDPSQLVEGLKDMKAALEKAGMKKHLICQPLGFWTPDAGKDGYLGLPEFPFGTLVMFRPT